ncbi:DUF6279 family lipoprotein [Alteromonas naphthalenivorans]|uniref:Lipoprotein n=1 Tax=Alteromonas naphthalenivorans TaxID=715451 RepID=F5ZDF3_ALTNA|nr:DUF6279 family lipoprotein [Alteromonas naphthalenivorans]AEF03915.1 hypothetical protein ambt_11975 [Alteromonas naphthalenivorans]
MKKLWLVLGFLVLTGCSSKLAYNNLDWLIYWYMDDYVELNDSQEAIFDIKLEGWIDWHREEQLALYLAQLEQITEDIKQDKLNKAVIANHLNQANEHVMTLRSKIAPELAELASRLSDDQVIYLFAAIQKENDEEQEELDEYDSMSESERLEKLIENFEEGFEDSVGDLTDEQKTKIANAAPHFARTRGNWLEYRIAMQNEARRLFASRQNTEAFQQKLTHLLTHPDDYRTEEYLARRQANREAYLSLADKLVKTMTAKQKSHLLKKLNNIIDDIKDLQDD